MSSGDLRQSGASGTEWRKVGEHEWWLVFKDAPADLGRDGPVGYPPSMVISWVGFPTACVHLWSYYNGAWPGSGDAEENCNYLHICEPADLIAELQDWMRTANYKGEED